MPITAADDGKRADAQRQMPRQRAAAHIRRQPPPRRRAEDTPGPQRRFCPDRPRSGGRPDADLRRGGRHRGVGWFGNPAAPGLGGGRVGRSRRCASSACSSSSSALMSTAVLVRHAGSIVPSFVRHTGRPWRRTMTRNHATMRPELDSAGALWMFARNFKGPLRVCARIANVSIDPAKTTKGRP